VLFSQLTQTQHECFRRCSKVGRGPSGRRDMAT
jgi:hypothetical protein